ncbi:MAG: hypothetical protein ACRD0U_10190, partial [Acidimicrobiales bacterium]
MTSRGGTAILAAARVTAVAAVPALAVAVLTWLGRTELSTPPLGSLDAVRDWVAQREPIVVAFAILRVAVLALAWVVLAATVAGGAGRLVSAARLVALTDRLTPSALRNLVARAAGPGLASLAAVPIGLLAGATDPP